MTKFRVLKPREVISILETLGFAAIRQRGAHKQFRHPDGRGTTVPVHPEEDISPILLRQIAKDIGLTVEQLFGGSEVKRSRRQIKSLQGSAFNRLRLSSTENGRRILAAIRILNGRLSTAGVVSRDIKRKDDFTNQSQSHFRTLSLEGAKTWSRQPRDEPTQRFLQTKPNPISEHLSWPHARTRDRILC